MALSSPDLVRKVPIEREFPIRDRSIHFAVQSLDLSVPCRSPKEGLIQLGKVFEPDADMKLGESLRREPELAARDPERLQQPLPVEVAQIAIDRVTKLQVFRSIAQVTPNLVIVHLSF
mgnify:CR=1 FL=1